MGQPARSDQKPQQESPAGAPGAQPRPPKSVAREYGEALGIALVLAILIRTFFIQAYKIPSGSMEPTLLIGDHLMVDKIAYGLRMPDSLFGFTPFSSEIPYGHYLLRFGHVDRGDVVVFDFPLDPTKDFIKRVIAIGGETIAVKNGEVYLNGKLQHNSHAHYDVPANERSPYSPRDNFGPFKVPKGQFFMMGDNRDHSYDSRFWGTVKRNAIEGRAMFIYWSWGSGANSLFGIRWDRIGEMIR